MPVQNQDGVVVGIPVDYFHRYEEPTTDSIASEPPCNNHGGKLRPCLKRLAISLLVIITLILFSLVILGICFMYLNKAPDIRIDSINAFDITGFYNNHTVSFNWRLTFSLDNPNELVASIRYKMIRVSVFHGNKRLSSANVESFYQHGNQEGHMNVEICGLGREMGKQMVVSLKLEAVVWLENKLYIKNHWQLLEATCGDVKVGPSTTKISWVGSGSADCNVNIL